MNKINLKELTLKDYPYKTFDKIRYCDTDRQGHVNNAIFSTFLETGRVEILYNPDNPLASPVGSFVIAKINLDLISEIRWPGTVNIGTGIVKIGSSSIQIIQGVFQDEKLAATAETVIVQIDEKEGGSKPLNSATKSILNQYLFKK